MALSSPSLNTRVPEPIAASVGNSIRGGVATRMLNDSFFFSLTRRLKIRMWHGRLCPIASVRGTKAAVRWTSPPSSF